MGFIERPPEWFRRLVRGGEFRLPTPGCGKDLPKDLPQSAGRVFLTFDDGPIPEVTPWVLDILDRYGVKATFFMVGQNAERYPELVEEIRRRGHRIGNHTLHHLQGAKVTTRRYLRDVAEADRLLQTDLFRPPHGWLRPRQARALRRKYRIIMYDLVTRDYSRRLTAEDVVGNVRRYARDGSIIVFHDSLKSLSRLRKALPEAIEWLQGQGYSFELF
ncbi:MAG: polysaccharide deacetylase family protein [Muribaculaceae bacterium]|nr:polysaccharide deacetylase family protein [Muribaculaceae bacterium]